MYSTTYSIHKNKIRLNIPAVRQLLESENADSTDAVEHYETMINEILKKHNTITAIINVESLLLDDIKHVWFIIQVIIALQKKFKKYTEAIHITNSSAVFKILFESVKGVIDADVIQKITVS